MFFFCWMGTGTTGYSHILAEQSTFKRIDNWMNMDLEQDLYFVIDLVLSNMLIKLNKKFLIKKSKWHAYKVYKCHKAEIKS